MNCCDDDALELEQNEVEWDYIIEMVGMKRNNWEVIDMCGINNWK